MKAPQAWRIYHGDAMNKTEITTSPTRVRKAKELGYMAVELVEERGASYEDVHDAWYKIGIDLAGVSLQEFFNTVTELKNERIRNPS